MAKPYTLDYTFKGNSAKRATVGIHTAVGLTLAQYDEGAGALAGLLDGFTNGILLSGSMNIPFDISGLISNLAEENSDVEEISEIGMVTTEGEPVVSNVPGTPQAFFIEGSDDLDQSAPDLAALISMFENGLSVTSGTIIPTDTLEVDILSVTRAQKRTKPSGTRGN
ncbi:hypothetical protein LCGC14_1130150 [marine sediment metagenome]|uniref:Uncharacterized protein n=1 Tax=marine sediment metagenome TaxID=412755 RepID=A0A0F9PJK7_9ZZZZ